MKMSLKLVLATAITAWASVSSAQITSRWTIAANGVWSDGANWAAGAPPAGGGAPYVLEFLTASTYTADNNLDDTFGDFNLNMLRLGGGAVTLTGKALRFVNNGAARPVITNNAAVVVKVNNNIEAANSLNVGAAANGVVYLTGSISGSGGLTNGGAGTVVITGNNTYAGETVARSNGSGEWQGLVLSNTTGGVAVPGNLRIGDVGSSYVRLGANEQIADTAVITFGTASMGRLQLLGRTETVAGIQTTTDAYGAVQSKDQNDAANVFGMSTLILNPAEGNTYRFAGYLRGGFNAGATDTIRVIKNGAGTQIFAESNIGQDGRFVSMQVNAGTLALSNTVHTSFQTGIEIAGTGKLLIENARDASKSPITNNVANGLSFGLTNLVAIGGLSGTGAIELKNRTNQAVTLIIGSNNTAGAYSGNLSGDGSLVKVGTGEQVLSGNNTYTGTTMFTNGLVHVTHAGALPGYGTAGKVTVGGRLGLNVGGAGWTETQLNTLLATSAFSANSALILDVAAAANIAVAAALPITSGLTKTGGGTLTLADGSTYANGTAIYGGTVVITATSGLGAGSTTVTNNGGVLRAGIGSGNFSLGRQMVIGESGATISADSGAVFRFGSTISSLAGQSGILRVGTGAGTIVLEGNNTHSGGTIVEAGAHVAISEANVFGTGALTLVGGRVRPVNGAVDGITIANHVILSADSTLGSSANQNPLVFTGAVTLSNGTHTLTIDNAGGVMTIRGAIGDGGNGHGLTKSGTVNLVLGGQSTYTGPTRVMAGSLILTNDASLTSGTLQINFGATMDVTGRTGGSMALAANQTLQGEGTFVGGLIAGDQSVIAPGSSPGTLEVNGDLTFEGTTTLEFDLLDDINIDSDFLNVLGDLKKGTGFDSVVFDFLGSGQMGTYALIGFVNSELVVNDFQFTNLKSGLSVDTVSLDNNELSLTVIPEPASLGIFGIAALAALLRRRLRRGEGCTK